MCPPTHCSAHGFSHSELGPFQLSYFGLSQRSSERRATRILAPTVPPTGSVHRRAERLLEAIHQWDERRSGEVPKGHSMGGLDVDTSARAGWDSLVSTVMTVGTPHRGSMLSDLNLTQHGRWPRKSTADADAAENFLDEACTACPSGF